MKYINTLWICVLVALLPIGLNAQNSVKKNENVALTSAGTQLGSGKESAMEHDNDSGEITEPIAGTDQAGVVVNGKGKPVHIAYRDVDPDQLMGGISYVNMQELLDKNYITYSLSDMEGFVGGFNGNIWGNNDYLLLVDGVPRDAGSVLPTEIDQVTFLKGISAVALYGSRAAKGVILITTKRGSIGDRTIHVRVNGGALVAKSYPKFLGSAEYMSLYNEATLNDGLPSLKYSDEDIYNTASGENPFRYPNTDYYSSDYVRDVVSRYDATVEITGGNERARYYTNLGFYTEGSFLNFGQAESNRTNRFNIRGNIDMKLNDFITAKVDASAIYYAGEGVNTNYWEGASTLRPDAFSPLLPIDMIDPTDEASLTFVQNSDNIIGGKYLLGGSSLYQTNPIGDVYAGGSNTYNSRQFQFNTSVDADLGNLLDGLTFSTLFGLDYSTTYNQSFNNSYAVFNDYWVDYNGEDQLTLSMLNSPDKLGSDASSRTQNINNSWYRQTLSMSGVFSYNNTFSADHNVSAMLIAGGFQRSTSSLYHKTSNVNMGLHLGYDFKNKYYAEFNGSLIHSAKLPEDNRNAFSPTVSLGWRISNEDFMSNSSIVNNLKVHVSAGIVHTDMDIIDPDTNEEGYFLYEQIYRQTDGVYYTWKDGLTNRSTDSRRGENLDMTFAKREEVSLGLDAALLDNLIVFNGSVFASRMTGLVVQNNVLFPNYFETGYPTSSFVPFVNYNNDNRFGFDFNVNVNKSVGDVDLSLGLTGIYYTTEASKRAEFFDDDYQNREGQPLDAIFGLENDGFFVDQADIDNSPAQAFGEVQPGDLKYIDQNGDNVINTQDEVYLGKYGWSGAPLTMGINLTAKWKNLTFFVLGLARTGAYGMKNGDYFWVNGDDKYSEVVRGRWTEETKATATYPRLTTSSGNNNYRNSDFWLYSTNRFDLARVQVSYDIPLTSTFVRQLGVYVNGANLLTLAPNREILELNINSSPQTRFFNLGVKAMF